ncbi:GNAT family N-acetyltransferase [Actinokineospora iranica]|uniref:Acetyltransferase (GNAT) family protein n=1 Tax=Actinokineospora iranica TaxID=1271860 RepID=A0A1G6JJ75_9PSEU|nr:GNAT family N-acetyltransferase [Actinokineospora iranica]SDC18741.1 Acetyltransferase (GNAT) family protein [Actinokineospora iranica]
MTTQSPLNVETVLAALDRQLRRDLPADARTTVVRTARLTRHVAGTPHGWSGVLWSDLDSDHLDSDHLDSAHADQVIAEVVAWFRASAGPAEWKHYHHDRPADLPRRLVAAGLAPGPDEAVMVAEAAAVPDFAPPPGVTLVAVSDEDGIAAAVRVHEMSFGGDFAWLGARMRDALTTGSMDVVLAVAADGTPVSAARTEYYPGTDFAGLWGGGTIPQWRGKGVYRALVSHRARRAQARGARYLQVDALPTSRPILERVGFTQVTTTTPYTLPEPGRT